MRGGGAMARDGRVKVHEAVMLRRGCPANGEVVQNKV